MLWGSVLVSAVGVVLAVPMAISIAYFIVFMANKRFGKIATVMIDLLAALPSVVLGLWGLLVFSPVAAGWAEMLNEYLGFIPIFQNSSGNFLRSPFIASWVVAVMIVPIIASVTREIFSQLDRELINASLALGAGRWSTFRRVIMPTSSGGVVGGILLGLGRALGETVAIFFVLNLVFDINWFSVLEDKGGSVASMILAKFGEAGQEEVAGLMAAGVVLFVVTLFVNMVASYIVSKAQPWRK
jgi:phosphate transport system permease protein